MIRCVLNAFVDDENQSDSLITIGKVLDNRVEHILCLFTYLSHRIPIYRAAYTIHTHTIYHDYDALHAMRYILPCHKRNMPALLLSLLLLLYSCCRRALENWIWKKNHMNVHTIIYRLFYVDSAACISYMRYTEEKCGWRLNCEDFAQTRCCFVIKLGKITNVENKEERKNKKRRNS